MRFRNEFLKPLSVVKIIWCLCGLVTRLVTKCTCLWSKYWLRLYVERLCKFLKSKTAVINFEFFTNILHDGELNLEQILPDII